MKWYTAVGVKKRNADGRFYVRVGMEEKVLTGMEIPIWCALLWAFCEESEIPGRLRGLLNLTFGEEATKETIREAEFLYCFRRLETRGLIAAGEGDTAEEAVEGLLRRVTMVRTKTTKAEQIQLFFSSLAMGKGIRFAMRAFEQINLTTKEEALLEELEADGKIDNHLRHLGQSAEQVAELVDGTDTKFARSVQQEFLAEVLALYGRKQLMIEHIL